MALQASRDVKHSARGFHKDTQLISHIRTVWMNSSPPAELAVDPSNMKEQKLQTKGVCYPKTAFFFSFFLLVSCKSSRTKSSLYHPSACNLCPLSNIAKLHSRACRCPGGLLAEALFCMKTLWFGNDNVLMRSQPLLGEMVIPFGFLCHCSGPPPGDLGRYGTCDNTCILLH